MTSAEVLIRAGQLAEEGEPFALATVVSVTPPASTRRGDRALVLGDGTVVGWVGGACSEPTVVREALRALADGEPRLVRIGPDESSCASEGTIEVLVEPQLPRPLLAVVGESPAARALAQIAPIAGWRVSREVREGVDAVVAATMGETDADVLEASLAAGAGYVGLVASSKRAASVLASLRERGVSDDALARVFSPAGLDLGPSTQEEIAVAIMAELVAWRHRRLREVAPPAEAIDPVCAMTVAIEGAREVAVHEGVTYYFCAEGCRRRFEAEPARYAAARA